ncbi:MAG: terminase small subunit [Anaerolineae bacterium]|nr:terminase small subunit [Anaerolineae bacterium]
MTSKPAVNKKQQAFIESYLCLWNATQAAAEAGYAHPRQAGSRLLSNVDIKEAIQARLEEMKLTADEVLVRLADTARFDVLSFATLDGGQVGIDLKKIHEAGLGHVVKKISYDTEGRLVVEFYDSLKAQQLVGQHHKLFTQRHQLDAPELAPLPEVLRELIGKVYGGDD